MSEKGLMIYGFDQEKIGLVKRTIAPDATDDELKLFLYQCQRTGLDPFARQIVFQKFQSKDGPSKMSIITSVDGYRLLADRTGKYAGSDDYRFDEGISEYEHIQTKRGKPITATCTVYKLAKNQRVPFTATVRWDEYYPGDGKRGFMWNRMPYLMLGKCAESLSLRKAFPAELSGLYTAEEMDQADPVDAEYTEVQPEVKEVKPETKKINNTRPYSPEIVKSKIEAGAKTHANKTASKEQVGLMVGMLEVCFAGGNSEMKRHEVCSYLTGQASSKKIPANYVIAMLDWLKPEKLDSGEYIPDGMAIREAQAILTARAKESGQQELI